MRPHVVVDPAEPIERTLLPPERPTRRRTRVDLEREVHAFMAPVLLRLPEVDAVERNPEPHPPDRELRQAGDRGRAGERFAVVGADRFREPVGPEQLDEDAAHVLEGRGVKRDAREQVAGGAVHDRQRVAELAVARAELSLEVDAPDVVRLAACGQWLRARRHAIASLPRLDHAVALEDGADRARRRPRDLRPVRLEPLANRDRSPGRELAPLREDELDELHGRGRRAVVGPPRMLLECGPLSSSKRAIHL